MATGDSWLEHQTQVLVVGGGIAGALAAARAQEQGVTVTLVDKSVFGRSGASALASGIFQCALPGDDEKQYAFRRGTEDRRGGSLVNQRLARKAIVEGAEIVRMLDGWGVRWIKRDGELVRARATATPTPQNAMMDGGGPQMMMAIRGEILRRGIDVVNHVMITDVLTSDGRWPTEGRVVGAIGVHQRTGEIHVFRAPVVILCCGPMKYPYPLPDQMSSTAGVAGMGAPNYLSSDGLAIGYRAGAKMGKMEFGGGGAAPQYLACAPGMEMFTGLGAIYRNRDGTAFLEQYDPELKNFAPRFDIVNAMRRELVNGRGPIYMDCRHFTDEQFQLLRAVLPIIMRSFDAAGYQLGRDLVPYVSQLPNTLQNAGGGVCIDETGRTVIEGLYAAGNNCDGAYVNMSQGLPGAAVTGQWAGTRAGQEAGTMPIPAAVAGQCQRAREAILAPLQREQGPTFAEVSRKLFAVLQTDLGFVLHGDRLETAIARVWDLKENEASALVARDPHELVKVHSICNYMEALIPALSVLLHRRESRGNILREDFPYIDDDEFYTYTRVRRGADGRPVLWNEPVPATEDFVHPVKRRTQHSFFAKLKERV